MPVFHQAKIVGMRVPAVIGESIKHLGILAPVDLHVGDSGFDQAATQQAALPKGGLSVGLASCFRFLRDLKCPVRAGGRQQAVGSSVEGREIRGCQRVNLPLCPVELLLQLSAVTKSIRADPFEQVQSSQCNRSGLVAVDHEWIVPSPPDVATGSQAGASTITDRTLGERNEGRQSLSPNDP